MEGEERERERVAEVHPLEYKTIKILTAFCAYHNLISPVM